MINTDYNDGYHEGWSKAHAALSPVIHRQAGEIVELKEGPFVLMFFDHRADDNRGCSDERGFYRSKARVEELVEGYNRELTDQKNAEAKQRWRNKFREWQRTLQVEPAPEFVEVPLKTTGRGWERDDYYFYGRLEFDDE